jgi:hypothetical protein
MSEIEKMKHQLIEAVRMSDAEAAEDVIPRLESLMEDWTESQVRDYLKYTLEGAYSTRLPLEEDQIGDEATLLVRTGQTAKCIVFRRTSSGIHILVNPPSMQPDPRLAIESEHSPRDRLVKTTTKRRNGWKLPGGRANAVDIDLAETQPFPSQTGVLLMTALREMTEEFGHCMQVVLKHDDAHFSYDASTEALIEFDMKFERPMLLLYAHRTHGPEVWESERVGKYPGVTRRSKVMFILGEVLDPLQQLPLNAPVYEEEQLDRRPHRWWPYSAVVHDDWIARGILPNMQIEDILPLENTPAFIPSPLHRRSLLDMQHWVTPEGTGIRVSVNGEEPRTDVETSEDKTMLQRQEKLDKINIEQVKHKSLRITKERKSFAKLMSWPAQDEKALVDYTKVRHEGGEKSAMFGFRYRIPKRATMLQTVYGLTALEARSRLSNPKGSDAKKPSDEELLQELFEKEYGRQPEPFLEVDVIDKAVKNWVKKNPDLAVNRTNMTDFVNLWLTSIQSLSLYPCQECGAKAGAMCSKKQHDRGELQNPPRFSKDGSINIGKWLQNSAPFFRLIEKETVKEGKKTIEPEKKAEYKNRRQRFIEKCLLPLLRKGLHKQSKTTSTKLKGFLSKVEPDSEGLQREQKEDLTKVINHLDKLLWTYISEEGKGLGIPFVHYSRYLEHFVDVEPFMALLRSDVSTARRSGTNTDFGKTVSPSLTQQVRLFSAQRRLLHRKQEENYDRYSFVETTASRNSRLLWEWVTSMEASDFRTVAIDDYKTVDGLHSVPVLSMEATQIDEPRFRFNESDTLRTSSLQERFVKTDDVWWWGETCPVRQEGMEAWLETASSGVGWGKLPIVSPDVSLKEAMDIAAMSGGYVAVGIDAYIWDGLQGPRNQQLSRDDEAWKISESLFADDNARISKDMNENEITITRTLPQSISQTPPLFVQRRLLGVLRLPLLDEA